MMKVTENNMVQIGSVNGVGIFQNEEINFINSTAEGIILGRFFTQLTKEGQSALFNKHLKKLRDNRKERTSRYLPQSVVVVEEFNVLKEMHNFLLRIVSTDKNEDRNDSIHDELKSISSEYIEMKRLQN